MLETVQATADIDLVGDPYDVAEVVARDPNLWHRLGHDQARLNPDATGLASLRLRRARYGDHSGRLQVIAEANLTRLLYGPEGKALTCPSGSIEDGLTAMLEETQKALPSVAPRTFSAWQTSRVDASATWQFQQLDSAPLFDALVVAFFSLHGSGRGKSATSRPGPRSLRYDSTAECQVRAYSKTDEALAKGSPIPATITGELLRIEEQTTGRTCRKHYGETLEDLRSGGDTVARQRLHDWLDMFGSAALAGGQREVFMRLRMGGMEADRAALLSGPAMMLRTGGIDALTREGINRRTAYRWAAEIRAAVPDDAWAEVLGIPLDLDDAAFADAHVARVR